jgi:hypothetical protein
MKYNPYLQAQSGIEAKDEGTFPQYQYYPYLYDSTSVGSFPRAVPWSNPIDNRMNMTDENYIQMFDEGSKKIVLNRGKSEIGINNYDRMFPDKSFYTDPTSSPQIQPRESNQPVLLRDRIQPIDYSKLDEEYDNAGAPVSSSTTPNIQPLQNFKIEDVRNPIPNIQPLQNFKIEDVMGTTVPIPNPDLVNPETLEYDPFTGLPVKKQFDQNILPDLGFATDEPQVSLDISPYKDDVEYIRAQRQQEPEIKDDPEFRKKYNDALNFLAPSIKLMTGINPNNNKIRSTGYKVPVPKPETTTTTTTETQEKKNKFGVPEAYYLGKSMLDATALIRNMVQPQPPSLQMKIPHYERQRLDPTPYDAMRSQMRDQGTQAYRLQRENISQASDLMKGLSAVTSGTQQGLMNVGMQQAGAEQQIQGINQQISMQEQQQQTQMLNQEAATNYQIQQQAQQYKDQMVSAQLQRLGDTAGAYAKYVNMKDIASKQDTVNKAAIQSNLDIQNAMLQYQMHKDAMDSDEYKSAWAQHWTKTLDQMSTDKIKNEKFGALKEYYGEMSPRYSDYQRIAMDPTFTKSYYQNKNNYENFQRLYPGGVAPDKTKYANDDDYNKAVAEYQKAEASSKAFTEDKSYKQFEEMQQFWTEIGNERNESGERKKFADQYMQQRGYYTTEQLLETVKEALDRSKQSLEFGG